MTDEFSETQDYGQRPEPSPELKALDRLVGTWEMSAGGVDGKVTFEWMEGGFFLIQHVDLEHEGQRIKGIEIIGHERPFGERSSSWRLPTGSRGAMYPTAPHLARHPNGRRRV